MARGIEQAEPFVLAMNVREQRASFFEQAGADGAIIEEGAGGRAAFQHAAEDERFIAKIIKPARGQERAHGMIVSGIEGCGHAGAVGAGRMRPCPARDPRAKPKADIKIDLPAPVSPVSALKPSPGSRSSARTRTKSRMERPVSMTSALA